MFLAMGYAPSEEMHFMDFSDLSNFGTKFKSPSIMQCKKIESHTGTERIKSRARTE